MSKTLKNVTIFFFFIYVFFFVFFFWRIDKQRSIIFFNQSRIYINRRFLSRREINRIIKQKTTSRKNSCSQTKRNNYKKFFIEIRLNFFFSLQHHQKNKNINFYNIKKRKFSQTEKSRNFFFNIIVNKKITQLTKLKLFLLQYNVHKFKNIVMTIFFKNSMIKRFDIIII